MAHCDSVKATYQVCVGVAVCVTPTEHAARVSCVQDVYGRCPTPVFTSRLVNALIYTERYLARHHCICIHIVQEAPVFVYYSYLDLFRIWGCGYNSAPSVRNNNKTNLDHTCAVIYLTGF